MYCYGIDLNIEDDTYILQYLIDVRNAKATKKLKEMGKVILGIDMIDLEDFFPSAGKKKSNITFALLPFEAVQSYGPADADVTFTLFNHLRPKLPDDLTFIYGIEIELLRRIGRMEYFGIRIDIPKVIKMRKESEDKKKEIETWIYKVTNRTADNFSIRSPKQIGHVMFEELGYPIIATTQSGNPATGKKVLKQLSEFQVPEEERNEELADFLRRFDATKKRPYPKYAVAALLRIYKEEDKLISSFFDKFLNDNIDGFIFPKYNQAGTESGRIAGYAPNLQQTAKTIRELFLPDSDEYYLLDVDYSQIEYRVMAGLGQEYSVIESFRNPEADYHITMYALMFEVPEETVDSGQRDTGKTLNFGVSFGMGDYSLAQMLYGSQADEDVERANMMITKYFDSVPNIRDMFTETKDFAKLNGYVKTLFNRRRYFPDINSPDVRVRSKEERKAGNTRVQGTAADILKISHVRLERAFERNNLDCRVIATVHDELLLLINKKYNPWFILRIVRKAMEIEIKDFPPLYVGATVCRTWADGKNDSLEIPPRLSAKRIEEVNAGNHRKAMENPFEQVANEIKEFIIDEIRSELTKRKIQTVEEAKATPRIATLMKKYLNYDWSIVGEILESAGFKRSMFEVIINTELVSATNDKDEDDKLMLEIDEMDNEDYIDEDDDSREWEDFANFDYAKIRQLHNINKAELKLPEPDIKSARNLFVNDYRVMVADKTCFIKVNVPIKGLMKELATYLKSKNVPKGYSVKIRLGTKMLETSYHLSRVDRFAIIDILERWENPRKSAN